MVAETSGTLPSQILKELRPDRKQKRALQWFRSEPEEHRSRDIKLLTHLVDDVKKRMTEGTAPECLTSQTVLEQEKNGMADVEIAYAVSSPFGAGIETVCRLDAPHPPSRKC